MWLCPLQVCQVSAQQPVQTELLMRYHQLQSRLATLRIENEEVRIYESDRPSYPRHRPLGPASPLPPPSERTKRPVWFFPQRRSEGDITICSRCNYPAVTLLCGSQAYICAVCDARAVLFAQIILMRSVLKRGAPLGRN